MLSDLSHEAGERRTGPSAERHGLETRAPGNSRSADRDFWAGVGERFPDLAGAASTEFYSDNERRLFTEHFPALDGLRILKTDLWDEAKNTRILAWAGSRGARAYGIDISEPTLVQARSAFSAGAGRLRSAVGDVRALPFADGSFDAVYSMGTIEHFDETEQAVAEIARVLRPGGRAIIGVPNRHDPFLRPLLATALQALGLYGYGYEKSYSRRALRQMLERAGLEVLAETAILFIPGGLRMLDLACHAWCRPLARVTAALVRPFVFLDRHVPAVRRHGYLLATVAVKPGP
jgi:SAM-dependent methyltransferase